MYHKSVLLNECIEALSILENGIYVDLTFGGGGHSAAIMNKLGEKGRLYAFDQDADAHQNALSDYRFELVQLNFELAADYLYAVGIEEVDGVLADLGVSSYQLDTDQSGFSFRDNVVLDMRMDKRKSLKASDILNTYSEKQLQVIFQVYGEIRNAKTLASRIVAKRALSPFRMSQDLNDILESIKFGHFTSYAAPVYQALRMEVNDELGTLKRMLHSISQRVKIGGRIAIITFHSLEDRLVKNFMRYGKEEESKEESLFGKKNKWNWELITKKPIRASKEEVKENPRSRSAKLRVIERKY